MGQLWFSGESGVLPFVGMPKIMSMDALLMEINLKHLTSVLGSISLDECELWLAEGHAACLQRLQRLGVAEMVEQDTVLNALFKARSEGRLLTGNIDSSTDVMPRIWLISDVHTDHAKNMQWLKALPSFHEDVVVVAGDVSHELLVIEETLSAFQDRFETVFFIPGNHEAWSNSVDNWESDMSISSEDSLCKLEEVRQLCQRLNVRTSPQLLGGKLWIVPLHSWYDLSLDLAECVESLAHHAYIRKWADFGLCKWPEDLQQPVDFTWSGSYPVGLAESLVGSNENAVNAVNAALKVGIGDSVLSFSHFLPNARTLPDWMDPSADSFKPEWLAHSAACDAMRFARVAGSELIDAQLRRITAGVPIVHHVHAFGHSHRPKDFVYDGVRYVNNPVGSPAEQRKRQVPSLPALKLLWNADGPVPAASILRYWEEHGGLVG